MAAKLLGLKKIIVVDIVDSKLELAKELEATHSINSLLSDPVAEVMKITDRGVLFAIDCSCVTSVIELLIGCIHPFGTAGSIGDAPAGAKIQIDALKFMVEGKLFLDQLKEIQCPKRHVRLFSNRHIALTSSHSFYPNWSCSTKLENSRLIGWSQFIQ